jgi:riboflavin synthase
MFSGIIKSTGVITAIEHSGTTRRITITSPLASTLSIDQSVAHDGVCLTVIETTDDQYQVDVVHETLTKTTFQSLKVGHILNLETSLSLSTLLDGHIVQGHTDTTLKCLEVRDLSGSWNMKFDLPAEYAPLVILHGSICLNGVSLTVARLDTDAFEVAVIPFTFEHTNFQLLQPGSYVNAEFDVIGKYILRQNMVGGNK